MGGCRFLMMIAWLGLVPSGALAVESWMPERPTFHGLVWDVAVAPAKGCEVVEVGSYSLLSRLSAMAGIRQPDLYLCGDRGAAAWTLPPRAIAVTGELANLPFCQKAFVLGHELAHLAMRHAEETAFALRNVAHLPTASAADAFSAADFDMSLLLHLQPLLRAQEAEADRLGALLAAGLGCRLEQSGLAYLKRLPPGGQAVLKTHDGTAARLRELRPFVASAAAIVERQHRGQANRQFVSGGGF